MQVQVDQSTITYVIVHLSTCTCICHNQLLVVRNASTGGVPMHVISYVIVHLSVPVLLFQRLLVVTNASTVSPNYL